MQPPIHYRQARQQRLRKKEGVSWWLRAWKVKTFDGLRRPSLRRSGDPARGAQHRTKLRRRGVHGKPRLKGMPYGVQFVPIRRQPNAISRLFSGTRRTKSSARVAANRSDSSRFQHGRDGAFSCACRTANIPPAAEFCCAAGWFVRSSPDAPGNRDGKFPSPQKTTVPASRSTLGAAKRARLQAWFPAPSVLGHRVLAPINRRAYS